MTTYTNCSPIDAEDITSETGIMVISFNPDDPNDKPNVNYYSSQEDLDNGWIAGICPLTRKTHYVSVPLSTLTPEQLSSLHATGQTDTLQEEVLEQFQENSYARDFFNKSTKSSREVQKILDGFKEKIATIGEHHLAAKGVAEKLYADLTELKENTFNKLDEKKLAAFPEKARDLIQKSIPLLQKDLDWGSYLTNLAKKLCNATTKFISAGYHQGFFTVKTSNAVESAKCLDTELEEYQKLDR